MTVNPFWFGVLITLVIQLVLLVVFALIHSRQRQNDVEMQLPPELTKLIEDYIDREREKNENQ